MAPQERRKFCASGFGLSPLFPHYIGTPFVVRTHQTVWSNFGASSTTCVQMIMVTGQIHTVGAGARDHAVPHPAAIVIQKRVLRRQEKYPQIVLTCPRDTALVATAVSPTFFNAKTWVSSRCLRVFILDSSVKLECSFILPAVRIEALIPHQYPDTHFPVFRLARNFVT